jgi:beta-fructofuranosidase
MILRRDFLAGLMGTAAATALSESSREASPSAAAPANVLSARLAGDPLRPQYHLLPAANWMNDPNGPIWWNDRYHMFYQYNPDGAIWGNMHWGHAVSEDMIRWKHLPVALAPTPGGPDAEGCFSGTAVVDAGQAVILYTGVRSAPREHSTIKDGNPPLLETQCLAASGDPTLQQWVKLPSPVLAAPPAGMEVNGFRDPSPWRQGDWWYMVLATGIPNQGGAVLLYRSKDPRAWEFMHVLSRREENQSGTPDPFDPWEVWECPEFFALGGKHVLIFSTAGKVYWQSGLLDPQSMRFRREQEGILDYGSFYAAKTQLDKSGNRILWGWITESRPQEKYKAAGWAGMMSLPRVISIAADGRLRFCAAVEAEQLRGREQALNVTADDEKNRQQIGAMRLEDCCGEILCTVRRTAEPFALSLYGSDESRLPWLKLSYDPLHSGQFRIDDRPIPLALEQDENLEMHLYVDGSVIEAFVNGQIACTRRFYYSGNAQPLRLKWTGKTADIASLSLWQLTPTSNDRFTT